MPDYVLRAIKKFLHPMPYRPEYAPYEWTAPKYGSKQPQLTAPLDNTEPLDAAGILHLQQVVGTFLFYARAVDPTMLTALSDLSAQQSQATEHTAQATIRFLNYAAINPLAIIRYIASDMVLHIHSDASYLSVPKARSRAAGHHFLSDMPADPLRQPQPTDIMPPDNGAVLTVCTIMKNVVGSAAESEFGTCYINAVEACPLVTALTEMGHPQPPTPLQTDNDTTVGIANKTVKQRRSKAFDMRYYWLQDRC
jgi:hypothetical protein